MGIDDTLLDPQHGLTGVGLHEVSIFAWFSGFNVSI